MPTAREAARRAGAGLYAGVMERGEGCGHRAEGKQWVAALEGSRGKTHEADFLVLRTFPYRFGMADASTTPIFRDASPTFRFGSDFNNDARSPAVIHLERLFTLAPPHWSNRAP